MNGILICTFAAFLVYLFYNFVALSLFGVPESLSNTFYLYKERKHWQRLLFPIMMVFMAFTLMPAWLEMSEGSNFQFLAFLAAGGIMFTGAAPAFKDDELENKVHTGSAIAAAICSLLWIILVAKLWYFIILWFIIISFCAVFTNSYKTAYVYWLETVAFMSTYTAIIAHYLG
jgi:hypothetical protein